MCNKRYQPKLFTVDIGPTSRDSFQKSSAF